MADRHISTVAEKPAAELDHFHRWRIDEPNGPISTGTCKVCGKTRQFKNWLAEGDFITNEEHRAAA
jgi:translation initiation factor IF-1